MTITSQGLFPTGQKWEDAIDNLDSYVITLTKDEYNKSEPNIVRGGFRNVKWFQGIRGKDKRAEFLYDRSKLSFRAMYEIEHAKTREAHSSQPSWGGVGCYLSHTSLWQEARKTEYGIFIFEADAYMEKNSYAAVKQHLMNLANSKTRVDMLVFGHFGCVSYENSKLPGLLRATGRLYGLSGYYISPHGAERLLKYAFPIEVQLDSYTGYMIHEENARIFYTSKILAPQKNEGKSSIQDKRVQDAVLKSWSPLNNRDITGKETGIIIVASFLFIVILGLVIMAIVNHAKKKKAEKTKKKRS